LSPRLHKAAICRRGCITRQTCRGRHSRIRQREEKENGRVDPRRVGADLARRGQLLGGLCYLVVRRDLPPRKAVGVIVIAIAFGLFAADWVAQKTDIPGGVIGLAFGFGAIWVVDRIDDDSLPKMLKGLLLRWVQK
jgi:hypothetical protein